MTIRIGKRKRNKVNKLRIKRRREAIEQRLAYSEDQLNNYFDSTHYSLYVVDPNKLGKNDGYSGYIISLPKQLKEPFVKEEEIE